MERERKRSIKGSKREGEREEGKIKKSRERQKEGLVG